MSETHNVDNDRTRGVLSKQLAALIALMLMLVALESWQVLAGMSVKAQSWEYIIEAPRDEELSARLHALGVAGWEIVSARRATSDVQGRSVAAYEMILRRPAAAVSGGVPALPPRPQ